MPGTLTTPGRFRDPSDAKNQMRLGFLRLAFGERRIFNSFDRVVQVIIRGYVATYALPLNPT